MEGSSAERQLPLITLLGLSFGNLLGGAAVVEIVFSWPGLGYLAVQSIIYRDFQLVQGIVLWIALMYMVINLIVDISYNHLDPRLRKAGKIICMILIKWFKNQPCLCGIKFFCAAAYCSGAGSAADCTV